MATIKAMVLSDLHLGDKGSLLTHVDELSGLVEGTQPGRVLPPFIECLRTLIREVNHGAPVARLILLGDTLELALCTIDKAAMAFERFLQEALHHDEPLFESLLYMPGNHDHHLWEMARETRYVHTMDHVAIGEPFPQPSHHTSLSEDAFVPSFFLTRLMKRFGRNQHGEVPVAYPNYCIADEANRRCLFLHHGHFIETLYRLISLLRGLMFNVPEFPNNVEDVEAENFAWIDFLWSTLGRSGKAGPDIEKIYRTASNTQALKDFLSQFTKNLARRYDLPGWGDPMEAKLMDAVIGFIIDHFETRERKFTEELLSSSASVGLQNYLRLIVKSQLQHDLGWLPDTLTFLFGHTHKPFRDSRSGLGSFSSVDLINGGGWVIETISRRKKHGASVLFISDDLEVVELRIYNEWTIEAPARVDPDVPAAKQSAFSKQIEQSLKRNHEMWQSLAGKIKEEAKLRAAFEAARIRNE